MRKSRNAATLWHWCRYGDVWLYKDESRSARNAVVTLRLGSVSYYSNSRLGLTPGNVRVRLHRARVDLYQQADQDGMGQKVRLRATR